MAQKIQYVVIKKKSRPESHHHSGAWKVAYADFVTALMSLFIVLWLVNSNANIRQAVAGYFNDPKGSGGLANTAVPSLNKDVNDNNLQKLKDKLNQQISSRRDLEKLARQIEIAITPEGLRIELLEDKNGTFFESGSAGLSRNGQELLTLLASELKTLPNNLLIEGHTDAAQYSEGMEYSNWELSADRANAARRLMQKSGVRLNQVTQVRGYADQLLRVKSNPYDPSNRRISILVRNYGNSRPVLGDSSAVGVTRVVGATSAVFDQTSAAE